MRILVLDNDRFFVASNACARTTSGQARDRRWNLDLEGLARLLNVDKDQRYVVSSAARNSKARNWISHKNSYYIVESPSDLPRCPVFAAALPRGGRHTLVLCGYTLSRYSGFLKLLPKTWSLELFCYEDAVPHNMSTLAHFRRPLNVRILDRVAMCFLSLCDDVLVDPEDAVYDPAKLPRKTTSPVGTPKQA
jgi:hypothetical protein